MGIKINDFRCARKGKRYIYKYVNSSPSPCGYSEKMHLWGGIVSAPSSTNDQHIFQQIRPRYTTWSLTNLLNHRICSSSTNTQANESNASILRGGDNTAVNDSSICSVLIHFFSITFFGKGRRSYWNWQIILITLDQVILLLITF